MKKNYALIAFAAMVCACSMDISPEEKAPAPVKLTMNVFPVATKAKVNDNADLNLDKVQILVFNKQNKLETSTDLVASNSQIELEVIPGEKKIFAVGNIPSKLTPEDYQEFSMVEYELGNNSLSKFIMSDSVQETINSSRTVDFKMKRLACKVVIDKIVRDFSTPAYAEIPLYIKKIYLSNVSSLSDLIAASGIPSSYCMLMGQKGNLSNAAAALVLDEGINYTLQEGGTYNTVHTFYAYPNGVTSDNFGGNSSSYRRTRLVVECEYNGRTCYYPITLPGEQNGSRGVLERNKVYHITQLTLKRPGSDNPDIPEGEVSSVQTCTFNIEVSPWDGSINYTENFT